LRVALCGTAAHAAPFGPSVTAAQKRRSYVDDVRAVLKKAESLQKAAVANAVKQ
jgi:hypothetical protein